MNFTDIIAMIGDLINVIESQVNAQHAATTQSLQAVSNQHARATALAKSLAATVTNKSPK